MTTEDRQILIANCEVVRELIDCQTEVNKSFRALFQALENHFPGLRGEYEAARPDTIFVNASSVAIGRLHQRIEETIERLKAPPDQAP
jgi:molybdopterin converting factor small subunit